jgi:hypothetical protein
MGQFMVSPFSEGNGTSGNLTVLAGNGTPGFGDGSVADCDNHRIRKISSTGIISTVAGTGNASGCDAKAGLATAIALRFPMGVAVASDGNLYIADSGNNLIRKVDTTSGEKKKPPSLIAAS